jgi:hypothetical protein
LIGQFRDLADREPRDLRCFTLRYFRWAGPKLSITSLDASQTIQEFLTEASYCFHLHYFAIFKSLLYKQLSDVIILYEVYGENMWGIGTTDGKPIVLEGQITIFHPLLLSQFQNAHAAPVIISGTAILLLFTEFITEYLFFCPSM